MICGQNRGCSDQSFWWFRAFRALEVDRFSIILHLFHIHNLCHTEISSPSIRIYDIIFRLRRIQRCLFIFLHQYSSCSEPGFEVLWGDRGGYPVEEPPQDIADLIQWQRQSGRTAVQKPAESKCSLMVGMDRRWVDEYLILYPLVN